MIISGLSLKCESKFMFIVQMNHCKNEESSKGFLYFMLCVCVG